MNQTRTKCIRDGVRATTVGVYSAVLGNVQEMIAGKVGWESGHYQWDSVRGQSINLAETTH